MAKISGQITVTTAGTAVAGPTTPLGVLFMLQAHPDNTGVIYVGNDGQDDVSSSTGFPLKPGEPPIIVDAKALSDGSLKHIYFDATVSGEKCCFMLLDGKFERTAAG